MWLQLGVSAQHFLLVSNTAVVENHVLDHHQELLALSAEAPGKRVLTGDVDQPFPYPRPELFLRGPEFVVVSANNSSCLLRFHSYALVGRAKRVTCLIG